MRIFLFTLVLLSAHGAPAQSVCVSEEEDKLYRLIMQYRKTKKLKGIPFSSKLTQVAQAHVRDLVKNFDYENRGDCNPHSWSSDGLWAPCCYTSDHKQAACMWNKPSEIAGYESEGYEIAYYSSGEANADEGLEGWKRSPGHNPLLINTGTWAKIEWRAIGIGIYSHYAVVWFGVLPDPSQPGICP
ncbi:MAG: CAP domain-containing protein [Cytophagales bacterium]|nr:CAP domain-containing protein [Cytophagales bacterium]